VCLSNLHQITVAMLSYATQNSGWIPGGPTTTGGFLLNSTLTAYGTASDSNGTYSETYCPEIVQNYDWMSPIAKVMGVPFDEGGSLQSRVGSSSANFANSRFHFLNAYGIFRCPENQFLVPEYSQDTWNPYQPTDWMPSYVTAGDFLLLPNFKNSSGWNSKLLLTVYCEWGATSYYQTPSGYAPKLNKVQYGSRKIYIADGGKWSDYNTPSDYGLSYDTNIAASNYSDYGAFDEYSRALCRAGDANGDPISPKNSQLDPRLYGFRHGLHTPWGPTDKYRFNAAFFDGHAETMGDLQGADPALWNPTGTQISSSEMLSDVQTKYTNNAGIYTVP